MTGRSTDHPLSALLSEAQWTGGELARAVNSAGTTIGLRLRYDRTSVAHWLSGSRPRGTVADIVAAVLSRRLDRPVTTADTGLLVAPARPFPAPGSDPVDALLTLCRTDLDAGSRSRVTGVVYVPVQPTVHETGQRPRKSPRVQVARQGTPRQVREEDLRRMQAMTALFAGLTETHGGAHARTALAAYLSDDVGHVLTGSGPLRGKALGDTARLAHLLGLMTQDAHRDGLAQHYFHASLALGALGDDRPAVAVTLRALSAQALRLGHLRHAHELAERAVAAAANGEPALRAFTYAQRAVAHAHLRRAAQARADLAEAERQHARGMGPPGPFTSYPRAALEYQSAQTLAALRDDEAAVAALRRSVAERSVEDRRGRALTRARLAELLAGQGELDEACRHWHAFLDDCPYIRSARADDHLTALLRTARRLSRCSEIRAVRERAWELHGPVTGGAVTTGAAPVHRKRGARS
ncbi:hypothetical protein GCM10022403_049230 [Streptomyces coacervatus]|uniref:Transcriptional regulator n=1 Tax=Streptomyces coacervatus TaxID=647381 RepID=A0ABP7I565_9ACTN|nr:hypothetical protein [Streptomyces coacervatus]MDF2266230.1 hypothetical protein [Streptomyces coacervatus]